MSDDPYGLRGPGPPPGGDQNRGPTILGIVWMETGIAIGAIALRFWGRRMIQQTSWDDWLMLITLILLIVGAALITLQASVGGYRHVWYLSDDNIVEALKINFICRVIVYLSYASGKASIGAFILRLIRKRHKWQEWVVWTVIVITAVVNIVACILLFLQCSPVQVCWDPRIPGECWDIKIQIRFGIFVTAENIVANVILSLLPVAFLCRLTMDIRKKISLSILFGMSLIATVASFMKLPALAALKTFYPDFTWGEFKVTIWSASETWVIIVFGSLPGMKPLWDRYITKRLKIDSHNRNGNGNRGRPDDYGLVNIRPKVVSTNETWVECNPAPSRRASRRGHMDPEERGIRATTRIEITRSMVMTDEKGLTYPFV